MNLKPAVLKNFVFDWAMSFRLCEVYRFQNLVGLELPIKQAHEYDSACVANILTYIREFSFFQIGHI